MNFLSFSNSKSGKLFSISLVIFSVFSLTTFLKWLPVIGVQMPIIIICYVLLLASCRSIQASSRVIITTIILFVFDYFFIYTQESFRLDSFQNAIGFNYAIFVSFFPILYVVSGNFKYINKRKFLNFVYVISFITALTTIWGTFVYESPCRELATPRDISLHTLYKSHNIGGYGFIYFIVMIIPILIKELQEKRSIYIMALFLFFVFCIYRSEYTTALLLLIISVVLSLTLSSKSILLRAVTIVGCIVLVINSQKMLEKVNSSLFDYSYTVTTRIDMISDYSKTGDVNGDLENREFLYMLSFNAFRESPLFGNFFNSIPKPLGGHSELLDYIGNSGLFGIFTLVFLIVILRKNTPVAQINYKDPFIKSTMVLALILAALNTFLSPELYFAILIVPLLVSDETII